MSEIEGARQSKYYGNLGSACMQQGQQHSMSTGASHDGRNAGGSDGDVQYFDSDFSFEEHAAECVAAQERTSDGCDESSAGAIAASPQHADCDRGEDLLLPRSQSKVWDAFHSHHSAGNFYKPRRYLIKSFPCILQYLSANDDGGDNELQTNDSGDDNDGNDDRILLEIGCGSGSSCIPIIKRCSEVKCSGNGKRILLACDASPVAVETTSRLIEKMMEKDSELSFGVFAADPGLCEDETDVPFLREVNSAYKKLALRGSSDVDVQVAVDRGLVGIVLMVFVLSAVTPSRVGRFLEQVYEATKPSGRVCFRDYGKKLLNQHSICRVRSARHSLECSDILHFFGKMSVTARSLRLADAAISRRCAQVVPFGGSSLHPGRGDDRPVLFRGDREGPVRVGRIFDGGIEILHRVQSQ